MRPKIFTWHDKFGPSEARALVPASDQQAELLRCNVQTWLRNDFSPSLRL